MRQPEPVRSPSGPGPVAPRAARRPDGLHVAFLPLDPASAILPAWRRLAGEALVENLFYEPDFAFAAMPAFGDGVGLLTVGDRPHDAPGLRLLALWPCRIVRRWGLPLPALMGWTHGFSIFGAPLIAADRAEEALRALLDAPRRLGLPPRLLLPYLPLDGPFAALLDTVTAETRNRRAAFWTHARGFLDVAEATPAARADYLAARLSPSKARQIARLGRRLGAEHETLRATESLPAALDDYIALESAGWKGRRGTAVAGHPGEAGFLRALTAVYGAAGRARVDRLRRDGRSLAVSLGFSTGSTFWYLKIAHDEAEARNSPGVQLVERVTRTLLADPAVRTADSCAPPCFPLIESFWGERRRLANLLIAAEGGDRLFRLAALLEGLRARAVEALKRLRRAAQEARRRMARRGLSRRARRTGSSGTPPAPPRR